MENPASLGRPNQRRPELVAAADWSVGLEKRRLAVARLATDGNSYEVTRPPQAVVSPSKMIGALREAAGPEGVAFVGFDFPIGLPSAYARAAGLTNFREALGLFESGPKWASFYEPTDRPNLHQPFAPATSKIGFNRKELARALGLPSEGHLLRRCDRKTAKRYSGESLFYLRFAKQVGRSAIQGWHEVIGPSRDTLRIWPFDGALAELLSVPGVVVAEIYPAEAAAHLGLPLGPGTGRSKSRQQDRATAGEILLAKLEAVRIALAPVVKAALVSGCDSEDDFDALLALVSMIHVLRGERPADPPEDPDVRNLEGWILGQDHAEYRPPQSERASVRKAEAQRSRERQYFIRRVWCGPSDDRGLIELAYPREPGRGALNVICGLNNAGKSFLLEQLYRVLKSKKNRGVIRVEPLPSGQPRVLFLGKTWTDKDKIGIVNLDQTASGLAVGGEHGDYLRSGLSLLLSQMAPHLSGVRVEEAAARVVEPAVREQIERAFEIGAKVYSCRTEDPLIQRLERVLEGRLYFRCVKRKPDARAWQFEFVLLYQDGTTVPYNRWSDGQRAYFYVLASLEYFRPEVILFDEVENHLHPGYISEVLEAMCAFPAQSIVATHHPHLIFSRFSDRVFYIDTRRPVPHAHPPRQFPYSDRYTHFERNVLQLEDDFERISTAYRLFTHQDDQLLRQASYVRTRATLVLVEALSCLFSYAPAHETPGALPDTQTQQLAERIRAFAKDSVQKNLEILDLGAGIGRQVAELAKLSVWQLRTQLSWTCYEPFESNRRELQARFGQASRVTVISDLSELRGKRFDFCILANVLHEVTPPEFARYIALADAHARYEDGGLLVLELFPLLHPEGHAVPYDPATLQRILDSCGFSADIAQISLRQSGTTAYCILARRRAAVISAARVKRSVERAWAQILDGALSAYALRQTPADLAGYQGLLSNVTTIASITSWKAQKWLPRWPGHPRSRPS